MQTPIIYYPLKVLCIDDDPSILEILKSNLDKHYSVSTFSSANEVLSQLDKIYSKPTIEEYFKKIINKSGNDEGSLQLELKIEEITDLSETHSNHEKSCIIICDYRMPDINGIEFFKKLAHLNVKKILLTEHQEYQEVLSAFNSGTIDLFLLKSDENLMTNLLNGIKNLSEEYFLDSTHFIKESIELEKDLPLSDTTFEKFFQNLLKEYNITEHYLADENGSFLLINARGERYCLVIHTDNSLDKFTNLYSEPDFDYFTQQISKRQKIPFFGIKVDPTKIELNQWNNFLYTPQVLNGKDIYYYHILKYNTNI
ncbi:MAG: response regulator [Neisseriaceae bacterium]